MLQAPDILYIIHHMDKHYVESFHQEGITDNTFWIQPNWTHPSFQWMNIKQTLRKIYSINSYIEHKIRYTTMISKTVKCFGLWGLSPFRINSRKYQVQDHTQIDISEFQQFIINLVLIICLGRIRDKAYGVELLAKQLQKLLSLNLQTPRQGKLLLKALA